MTVVKIEANVEWKYFRAAGGNWIAVCEPMALTVQSETYATLMEDIALTLNALMKNLLEARELEAFLHSRGWRPFQGAIPAQPDDIYFDVPFATKAADRDSQVALH